MGPTEFELLHFFMTHTDRVYSRAQILDQVWGDHVFIEDRTVDVHIRQAARGADARAATTSWSRPCAARGTGFSRRAERADAGLPPSLESPRIGFHFGRD